MIIIFHFFFFQCTRHFSETDLLVGVPHCLNNDSLVLDSCYRAFRLLTKHTHAHKRTVKWWQRHPKSIIMIIAQNTSYRIIQNHFNSFHKILIHPMFPSPSIYWCTPSLLYSFGSPSLFYSYSPDFFFVVRCSSIAFINFRIRNVRNKCLCAFLSSLGKYLVFFRNEIVLLSFQLVCCGVHMLLFVVVVVVVLCIYDFALMLRQSYTFNQFEWNNQSELKNKKKQLHTQTNMYRCSENKHTGKRKKTASKALQSNQSKYFIFDALFYLNNNCFAIAIPTYKPTNKRKWMTNFEWTNEEYEREGQNERKKLESPYREK